MGRGSFAVCDERPDQQRHPVGTRDTPLVPWATLSSFQGNREPVLAPISPFPPPCVSVIRHWSRSVPGRGRCTAPRVTDRASWQLPPRTGGSEIRSPRGGVELLTRSSRVREVRTLCAPACPQVARTVGPKGTRLEAGRLGRCWTKALHAGAAWNHLFWGGRVCGAVA